MDFGAKRRRVDLVENGPGLDVVLDIETGMALAQTGFIDARLIPGTRAWTLQPLSKVGTVALGSVEVHVRPKVPISRVIFLLESSLKSARWRDDTVNVAPAEDLLLAVVDSFERLASRALQQGLLQGYRTVDEAIPVVRGRLRESDQIRRRFALPVPVEVRYDDFTVDTAENRLLRAAVTICRRLPILDRRLRHRLQRLDLLLAGVSPAHRGAPLEGWAPSRLNARFHSALFLAEVIVKASSFERSGTGLAVSGFVIDMAKVFEDFLCAHLGKLLLQAGGRVATQDPWHLDVGRTVRMKPDLVWYADTSGPSAVVDAKYKAEKPAGFPDADLYQMLAYCTALRLPTGYLIYAKGNAAGATHHVRHADVEIRAVTIDLSEQPTGLLAQLDKIASEIVDGACPAAPPADRQMASRHL
ncbi:McrC family protein [Georgenia sp. EYE_87]|uniref:McrC family protein n=1 Tax=Georgenia sp. EYE_87 TaxID=2853448 RepID=UPI002004E679|nr:McrC family protein [Georgenia sp. EYE_87]MCK6211340.1 McrC family protein [Georgenia sp. EYE_87]